MSVGWIIVLFLAALGAQAALFSRFGLKALGYQRFFDRVRAFEGERVQLIEVLRNEKPLPVPWLRVESRISPNLRFGGEDAEREISAEQYHKSVFFLNAFSQVTRRHDVLCEKRGFYEPGSVTLTCGDLLSISQNSAQIVRDCSLTVYPRLLSEDEISESCTRWQGELSVKRWIMPDPFLTVGIRDYQMGDPVRDIHWRATARVGNMQVRVRDTTADPRAMVVLNVQLSEAQWGELMEDEQAVIEHGIRLAATLCARALDAGVEAGFASNGCLYGEKGQGKTVIVPARRDANQKELLLDTMARLIIHREITFPTFLEELSDLTHQDILILTAYESDAIRRQAQMLRARDNSVTVLNFVKEGGLS